MNEICEKMFKENQQLKSKIKAIAQEAKENNSKEYVNTIQKLSRELENSVNDNLNLERSLREKT
jgi:hypothetical protein